jgi:hypothetical protein
MKRSAALAPLSRTTITRPGRSAGRHVLAAHLSGAHAAPERRDRRISCPADA